MSLLSLLSNDKEPPFAVYEGVIEAIPKEPRQISSLVGEDVKDDVVFHLTSRSNRLSKVFKLLCDRHLITSRLATEIVDFLIKSTEALNEILSEPVLIDLLLPAVQASIPHHPPSLKTLATILLKCGAVLERLASSRSSSSIGLKWVMASDLATYHMATLETWTDRLTIMTASCTGQHGLGKTVDRWNNLLTLKRSLRELESIYAKGVQDNQSSLSANALPKLADMRVLDKSDKKSWNVRGQDASGHSLELKSETVDLLQTFGLRYPSSERLVQVAIEALQTNETVAILRAVARGFPCNLCHHAITHGSRMNYGWAQETESKYLEADSQLDLSILGKQMGVWKVLLSSHAIKHLQNIRSAGQRKIIQNNLLDLACGSWSVKLAGTNAQKEALKIPLAKTKCGKWLSLLWQVDAESIEGGRVLQQVIKVWDIVDDPRVNAVVDRAIVVQEMYSPAMVFCCRQVPLQTDLKFSPRSFNAESEGLDLTAPPRLDIRSIDRDTIDMANKFYAFTEPVINSVVANDLNAELPFDISDDEARAISHFRTASLILGRSGTGKTTCLIFKLVGKYLARKRIQGEVPIRQVLLTRSNLLAEKLKQYSAKLIQTLAGNSKALDCPQENENENHVGNIEEPNATRTVFSLSDDSFPLILTFDEYLTILENTISVSSDQAEDGDALDDCHAVLDFSNEPSVGARQHTMRTGTLRPRQLVDFHAFKLDYWPKMPTHLTKTLPIELVFAEIMGTLKGSASSKSSLAPLSRSQYYERSCRIAPTFTLESDRSRVYDIFEYYERLKRQWCDVDYVDRVVAVLDALKKDSVLSHTLRSCFDEAYIDEVQDQRCLDIELLLNMINDGRGLHFAGDTAQAISQDATFRFADAKALIYEHFKTTSDSINQAEIARPVTFALSKNYRSHQGILTLASFVMGMLWMGFPGTIDKLQPEFGQLHGPMPLLFLDCGPEILLMNKVGLVDLSGSTMEFGAEQVILVRDEQAQTQLQAKIGDTALVLTILQSKGMEFDDVILWNFFTVLGSDNPAGLRSLRDLVEGTKGAFDSRKYAGICSELKHLYVAITRARIQLILIESSEMAVAPMLELLTQMVPKPLIDISRPYDSDFQDRIKALQIGNTSDPSQWSSRGTQFMDQSNFKEAFMCFRRAKDHHGIVTAKAHLSEEEGRRCAAKGDFEGLQWNLHEAIEGFLEVNLVGDAARNFLRLDKPIDAANLLFEHKVYNQAAPLFKRANLFEKASICYDLGGNFDEAAFALRQGNQFDELISYVTGKAQHMSADSIRGHSRFCRLLLKQNRISIESRGLAIKMLGSLQDQETIFLQYEMYDQLIELYTDQNRRKELFYLQLRMGRLDEALHVVRESPSASSEGFEDDGMLVLDYVRAGQIQSGDLRTNLKQLLKGYSPRILQREHEWNYGVRLIQDDLRQLSCVRDALIRKFLCLYATLKFADEIPTGALDKVPFNVIGEAVEIVASFLSKPGGEALAVVLLLTAVFKCTGAVSSYTVLPWSPLREHGAENSIEGYTNAATAWVLSRLAPAMLRLNTRLGELWNIKWPRRCLQALTKGFCPNRQTCRYLHDRMRSIDCWSMLEDYLRISKAICQLTVIYYRRAMPDEFQENFLKIKRRWLERLFRSLTYLGSCEQDASSIAEAQSQLFHGIEYRIVANALEELLFYKTTNLENMMDLSSLFEAIQLSQSFGGHVEYRFLQTLAFKLSRFHCHVNEISPSQFLSMLDFLQNDISRPNASSFKDNLDIFLSALESTNLQQHVAFHAVLTIYEYFLSYIITRTQSMAFIVPRSWAHLHLPWFLPVKSTYATTSPTEMDIYVYQSCFLRITFSIRRILDLMDNALRQGFELKVGGRPYPSLLLTHRNVELLAIAVINLAKSSIQPCGFGVELRAAKEYINFRASHLRYSTEDILCKKLNSSFALYEDKNSLIVVQDTKKRHAFTSIQEDLRLKSLSWEDIQASNPVPNQSPSTNVGNSTGQPPDEESKAVEVIRRFWKARWPELQEHRRFMQTSLGKVVGELINLSTRLSAPLRTRALLVSDGVDIRLKLPLIEERLSETKKKTFTCIENVTVSAHASDAIGDCMDRLDSVDRRLKMAANQVSDDHFRVLIENRHLRRLEGVLVEVRDVLEELEDEMERIHGLVDGIPVSST